MMPFVRLRVILIISNVPSKDNCTYFLTLQVNFSVYNSRKQRPVSLMMVDGNLAISHLKSSSEI